MADPSSGQLSKKLGIEQFYRVGEFYNSFEEELKHFKVNSPEFPFLSEKSAHFISSAYGLPYPIAALKEFVVIMGKACENDKKRLDIIEQNIVRAPASTSWQSKSRWKILATAPCC